MVHRSHSLVAQRIRDQVAGLTAGQGRRYPARLQQQIVTYAQARLREGVARSRVCTEVGMSDPTLSRMLGSDEGRSPQLRAVRVVEDKTATAVGRVVVKMPGGIVVEGLDVLGVAALVRALSC